MIEVLLCGGCISNGYRVLDAGRNVIMKITCKTFRKYRHLFRKSGIVYLINKSKVRQEHGNSFIKKQYKNLSDGIRSNEPGTRVPV